MAFKYTPTKWVGGETIGTASVMNNIEQGITNVTSDVSTSKHSEDLLNENITSFTVGTGYQFDNYVDYTNDVEQSFISIDNIEGRTEKVLNNTLVSVKISNIGIKESEWSIPTTSSDYQQGGLSAFGKPFKDSVTSISTRIICTTPYKKPIGAKFLHIVNNGSVDYDISLQGCVGNNSDSKYDVVVYDYAYAGSQIRDGKFGRVIELSEDVSSISFAFKKEGNADLTPSDATNFNIAITFLSENTPIIDGDLELRSLPNDVKDTLKCGVVSRNVGYFDTYGLNSLPGQSFDTVVSNGTTYGRLAFNLPNGDVQGQTKIVCDRLDVSTNNSDWNSPNNNTLVVNLSQTNKARCGFVMANVTTLESMITALSINVPRKIIYQLDVPTQELVNTSTLAKNGDTIFVDSPIPLTCSHKVQLNTKSQVKELQEVVQKEKKSVLQKIKELTDVKMNLNSNGYIKLPTVLGGLLIQWGVFDTTFANVANKEDVVTYPITFTEQFTRNATIVSRTQRVACTCTVKDDSSMYVNTFITHNVSSNSTFRISWFVIGR